MPKWTPTDQKTPYLQTQFGLQQMIKELELAGRIQRELLPQSVPQVPNLDLAAGLWQAETVGGDDYDFLPVDEGNLMFYVSDVMGHGMPASLIAVLNNALITAFMNQYRSTEEILIALNQVFHRKFSSEFIMTMVMANWNHAINTLSFTQAGHYPILLYRAEQNQVELLPIGGMALGMVPDLSARITTHQIEMQPNDIAVLYTDGVLEARRDHREQYGMERLMNAIVKNAHHKSANTIMDRVAKDIQSFMGGAPQQDDMTLLVAKRSE
ncbi:PP2C family protein-serine/threonine phosphatase [Candidatus Peregrinibacteria bacterium]|nr:MAG: PP2C family protein-serine/threonine phosphatase [Candidatus Peregrinibacteria bacterium]